MNLNNFESYIDKKIVARGYEYYENDNVISVEETEENVYEAEVEGSDLYSVEVELDDKADIINTQCDCPYAMGEYCKHQVAVFFVLRKMKNSPGGNTYFPPNSTDSEAVFRSPLPKKKAGGTQQALEIRQKLFNKYANRPAFRDELSRV